MKKFSIQKKLLLISLIVIGVFIFALFSFKNYTLYPLVEKEAGCYIYHSDEDIKNIARHAISEKFGEKVLIAQKSLTVSKGESDKFGFIVFVDGEPRGFLRQLFLLIFRQDNIPTIRAMFADNGQCLRTQSIRFMKD